MESENRRGRKIRWFENERILGENVGHPNTTDLSLQVSRNFLHILGYQVLNDHLRKASSGQKLVYRIIRP